MIKPLGNVEPSKIKHTFNVMRLEDYTYVHQITKYLKKNIGMKLDPFKKSNHLELYKGYTSKGFPAALIGYGGSGPDLRALPTPLQTELLPLLFEHWKNIKKAEGNKNIPLLILGHSFDEVFLRKIRLLKTEIPDIRLIQYINIEHLKSYEYRFRKLTEYCESNLTEGVAIKSEKNDLQPAVIKYLISGKELGGKSYKVLDWEVPAGEGTRKSEVIDILALESKHKWLTVIEIKFENINKTRLLSVIFQGRDYCNWVEDHKRAIEMLFPNHAIVVRRRTRLILINGPDKFPDSYPDFTNACSRRDRYQEIELYYTNDHIPLSFTQFVKK